MGHPERPCSCVQQKQVPLPRTLCSKKIKGWEQSNRGEKYKYVQPAVKELLLLVAKEKTESLLSGKKWMGHWPLYPKQWWWWQSPVAVGLCTPAAPQSTWEGEREGEGLPLPWALTSNLCSLSDFSLFNLALQMQGWIFLLSLGFCLLTSDKFLYNHLCSVSDGIGYCPCG